LAVQLTELFSAYARGFNDFACSTAAGAQRAGEEAKNLPVNLGRIKFRFLDGGSSLRHAPLVNAHARIHWWN
jgi:hypothetical protein